MSLAHRISRYNRRRKWDLFLQEFELFPSTRVLDIGFSEKEYSDADNFIEKHYPYPDKLIALGVDVPGEFKRRYPEVTAVHYDGGTFPFEDREFDIAWSNAVIEHVGDRDRQLHFLKEIDRVSKRAFVTTPNRYFPVEVHTRTPLLHYLPKSVFDKYLALIGKKWATGSYMNLLSRGDLRSLLADAGITDCRIIHNRLACFTLDFVIVF